MDFRNNFLNQKILNFVYDSNSDKNFHIHSEECPLYKTASNFKKCPLVLPEEIPKY